MNSENKLNKSDIFEENSLVKESQAKLNECDSDYYSRRSTSDTDPNERVGEEDQEYQKTNLDPRKNVSDHPTSDTSAQVFHQQKQHQHQHQHQQHQQQNYHQQHQDPDLALFEFVPASESDANAYRQHQPLAYYNYEERTDQFEFELLRQIHKLYKNIPSKQVEVSFCRVKLIAYDCVSHYGLARSVAALGDGLPDNYLFHRNDFRNHPYLIDPVISSGIEFYAIVAKNGSTIPRVLQLDYEFIKMLKKTFNYYVFKCSQNLN